MGDIVSNIKTIDDYTRAKAASDQALQSGQLDALNKKNIYATQVLSAAAATGNQNAYDVAKKHLSDNGIDISTWAPDVQTGVTQANAARLAQSPLGSLLNAGLKQQSNDIALSGLTGQLPMQGLNIGGVPINISGNPQSKPVNQQNINPNVIANPWKNPDNVNSQASISTPDLIQGQTAPQTSLQSPQLNVQGGFTPPRQMPGETLKAYNDRVNMAFQQYKESPTAIASSENAKASASEIGKALGDAQKTATIMQSNLPMVLQRFQNMRNAAANAGYGTGNNNEGTGMLQEYHKNFQNDPTADANATLQQYAAQGILPELGPQLAQAGVKGNKFLESIASSASGLDLSANPTSKQKLINGLENTYISNLKSTLAQLRSQGENVPSDEEINAMVQSIKAGGFKAAQNPSIEENIPTGGNLSGSEKAVQKLDLYNKSKAQFDNKRKPVIDASEYFK